MLSEKFKNNHIILASGSPRRQELFKELGIKFTIHVKDVEENYPSYLNKQDITNYLAELKANAFSNELLEKDIVITADTIVWHNNKPVEKPKDKEEAIQMLQSFSDDSHKVISSVCIRL